MNIRAKIIACTLVLTGCELLDSGQPSPSPPAGERTTTPQISTGSHPNPNPRDQLSAFRYCAPGDLMGDGESGYAGREVFFPNIGFPVEFQLAAHQITMNSQMYMPGGYCSSGKCRPDSAVGSSCDLTNFQPPWRDTFCEEAGRTYGTELCPDGIGHQGLDIRPPIQSQGETQTCRSDHWFALAVQSGIVLSASGSVVKLRDRTGATYVYRHMNPQSIIDLDIVPGKELAQGDRIGRLDRFNNSGTRPYTSLHLHLEVTMRAQDGRTLYFPLYTSMIASHRTLLGMPSGIGGNGSLIVDPAREILSGCGELG